MHHSGPHDKFGHTVAVWLVEKMAYGGHVAAKKVWKQCSGRVVARADKDHVEFTLYWVNALLLRVKTVLLEGPDL